MRTLSGKCILIISPEPWQHLFVSKHNYSVALASLGNEVFFLNPPGHQFSVKATSFERVFELNYKGFPKGLRFYPRVLQLFFFKRMYAALERITNKKFDVVWSFDNSVFFDLSFLEAPILKICHIVDYSQNFQFASLARTANICFGVSNNIVARLARFNKQTHLIPHGLNTTYRLQEVTLPGKNKVKAVYAGNLDSIYLDHENLRHLIKTFPEVDFVFFGSGGDKIGTSENVHLAGRVHHDVLVNYLKRADILLLLYDWKRFPDQLTNAHKVLEYLFAGKTIVSSYLSDYKDKGELIEMSDEQRSVVDVFTETISKLAVLNNADHMARRNAFALENTYEKRIHEIEVLICNLNHKRQ